MILKTGGIGADYDRDNDGDWMQSATARMKWWEGEISINVGSAPGAIDNANTTHARQLAHKTGVHGSKGDHTWQLTYYPCHIRDGHGYHEKMNKINVDGADAR